MKRVIAVLHPSPVLRSALVEGLRQDGLRAVNQPGDLAAWLSRVDQPVVLMPPSDEIWESARRAHPGVVLVALIDHTGRDLHRQAYAAGATGVVVTTESIQDIRHTIRDALEGKPRVPLDALQSMAIRGSGGPPVDLTMTNLELSALRLLAAGRTVAVAASDLGCSERELHRLLGALYHRMGADSRIEAIVQATKWGILELTAGEDARDG